MPIVDDARLDRILLEIRNDRRIHHAVLAPTTRSHADNLDRRMTAAALARGRHAPVDADVLDALVRDGAVEADTPETRAILRTAWLAAVLRIVAYDRRRGGAIFGPDWTGAASAALAERCAAIFLEEYCLHRHRDVRADPQTIDSLLSADNRERAALLRRADIRLTPAGGLDHLYALSRGPATILMLGDDPDAMIAAAAGHHFQHGLAVVGGGTGRRPRPRLVVDNGTRPARVAETLADDDGPMPA